MPTPRELWLWPAGLPGPRTPGNQVVVVVSAMGDTTDDLIQLAYSVNERPDGRELALLLSTGEIVSCTLVTMALRSMGHDAIGLSGGQAGIQTDMDYTRARIVAVDPQRIRRELQEGKIVVVAGFQGIHGGYGDNNLGTRGVRHDRRGFGRRPGSQDVRDLHRR